MRIMSRWHPVRDTSRHRLSVEKRQGSYGCHIQIVGVALPSNNPTHVCEIGPLVVRIDFLEWVYRNGGLPNNVTPVLPWTKANQRLPGLQLFLLRTLNVSHMGGAMLPTNHFVSCRAGIGSISLSMAILASVILSWFAAKNRPGLS